MDKGGKKITGRKLLTIGRPVAPSPKSDEINQVQKSQSKNRTKPDKLFTFIHHRGHRNRILTTNEHESTRIFSEKRGEIIGNKITLSDGVQLTQASP